ncbi:BZ3500_MvSof-1268-A1-R1_Chr6-3g08943 [Microbotryum saponariae]|uniref:BZ3500_MvSof-1268-A1-R1_Chr6-3g08943 protein n=1 Tax=Microbotryum saponariae TaxID=289078 RepID=A0A2X0KQR4_9BASI|nr:BZ3500_MvSof-1268-A1-R1_Chr6-3g08943 [Microbotryum saponariae]
MIEGTTLRCGRHAKQVVWEAESHDPLTWLCMTGGESIPEKRKRRRAGGGGGHRALPGTNDIDANKYQMFYNNAREGSSNGRKVAKSYATPLPVNIDGHAELYAHTSGTLHEARYCSGR